MFAATRRSFSMIALRRLPETLMILLSATAMQESVRGRDISTEAQPAASPGKWSLKRTSRPSGEIHLAPTFPVTMTAISVAGSPCAKMIFPFGQKTAVADSTRIAMVCNEASANIWQALKCLSSSANIPVVNKQSKKLQICDIYHRINTDIVYNNNRVQD